MFGQEKTDVIVSPSGNEKDEKDSSGESDDDDSDIGEDEVAASSPSNVDNGSAFKQMICEAGQSSHDQNTDKSATIERNQAKRWRRRYANKDCSWTYGTRVERKLPVIGLFGSVREKSGAQIC